MIFRVLGKAANEIEAPEEIAGEWKWPGVWNRVFRALAGWLWEGTRTLSRDQAFPSISYPASVFPLVTNKHPLSLFYVTVWNLSQILMPPWGGDKGNSAGAAPETQDDGDTEGLCQAVLSKCERAYSNRLRLMRTREEAQCTLSEVAGNARTDLVPGGYSHSQRKSKQVPISWADTEQERCGSGSASVLRRKIKAGSRESVRMCRGRGWGAAPDAFASSPCAVPLKYGMDKGRRWKQR